MLSTKKASEMGEKLILYVIGIGAFFTALVDIFNAISSYSIQLEQLFTLFIYAEIIGMVGAYSSSSRNTSDVTYYYSDNSFVSLDSYAWKRYGSACAFRRIWVYFAVVRGCLCHEFKRETEFRKEGFL